MSQANIEDPTSDIVVLGKESEVGHGSVDPSEPGESRGAEATVPANRRRQDAPGPEVPTVATQMAAEPNDGHRATVTARCAFVLMGLMSGGVVDPTAEEIRGT